MCHLDGLEESLMTFKKPIWSNFAGVGDILQILFLLRLMLKGREQEKGPIALQDERNGLLGNLRVMEKK